MWLNVNSFSVPVFYGSAGKMNKHKLAKYKNDIAFQNIFMQNLSLASDCRYKVEGILPTMSQRVIRDSMIWHGGVEFFEKEDNLFALPAVPTGDGFNINGDPGACWTFSKNGVFDEEVKNYLPGSDKAAFLKEMTTGKQTGKTHGCYVYENYRRYPFINVVMFYSEKIADTYRTLDVCRKNIKNPYIITAEESVVPTVKKYFEDRDNNEDYIISSGIFDATKVSVVPLVVNSDNLSSCIEMIEWYENKYRELNGIDSNSQIDKKGENLISDEVNVNNMFTELSLQKCLDCMNEQMDEVNKIFGTHMKFVKVYEEKEDGSTEDLQGDKNGNAGQPAVSE